jgi:hypothetical protein
MKLKLDICKTCKNFEHFENGKVGCSFFYDEKWIYTFGEEGLNNQWNGLFKPFGNITLTITRKTMPYDEKTFESLKVSDDCLMYPEYCIKEWNEDEKKA